mgnify:CR=1 FL=1
MNITAASGNRIGASPTQAGVTVFTEDVGDVKLYSEKLQALWDKRTHLMKPKGKKKKKGSRRGAGSTTGVTRSALKNRTATSVVETETAYDDA